MITNTIHDRFTLQMIANTTHHRYTLQMIANTIHDIFTLQMIAITIYEIFTLHTNGTCLIIVIFLKVLKCANIYMQDGKKVCRI